MIRRRRRRRYEEEESCEITVTAAKNITNEKQIHYTKERSTKIFK